MVAVFDTKAELYHGLKVGEGGEKERGGDRVSRGWGGGGEEGDTNNWDVGVALWSSRSAGGGEYSSRGMSPGLCHST